jgi:hypothetical protein
VIQAIVALGRALDLTLLAEGVETEEQRVLLRLAGCGEMQGFLFAKPGPREALDRMLADAAHPPAPIARRCLPQVDGPPRQSYRKRSDTIRRFGMPRACRMRSMAPIMPGGPQTKCSQSPPPMPSR